MDRDGNGRLGHRGRQEGRRGRDVAGAGGESAVQRVAETSLAEGPQVVTRRGVEAAVLVPIEQWRRMERLTRPNIKDWLLAPGARTEALTPPRRVLRRRPPPTFE